MSNQASEKRRNSRVPCFVPVDAKSGDYWERSSTVDLSQNGLGLVANQPVPVRREMAIELDLEDDLDPVFVLGEVRWVAPLPQSSQYRVGLVFKNILQGSKARLERFFKTK